MKHTIHTGRVIGSIMGAERRYRQKNREELSEGKKLINLIYETIAVRC